MFSTIVGGWEAAQWRLRVAAQSEPLPDSRPAGDGSCAIWFIGSSTAHRWPNLSRITSPWIAHNRGVDGALIREITPRLAAEPPGAPPQAIIFYAGDNDIARGLPVTAVLDDLRAFLATKQQKLGSTPVVILSVKPSPARWADLGKQRFYNATVQAMAAAEPDVTFVDIRPAMLVGARPGPFFVKDGIHMNSAGYERWNAVVAPALRRLLPADKARRCAADERHAHG